MAKWTVCGLQLVANFPSPKFVTIRCQKSADYSAPLLDPQNMAILMGIRGSKRSLTAKDARIDIFERLRIQPHRRNSRIEGGQKQHPKMASRKGSILATGCAKKPMFVWIVCETKRGAKRSFASGHWDTCQTRIQNRKKCPIAADRAHNGMRRESHIHS